MILAVVAFVVGVVVGAFSHKWLVGEAAKVEAAASKAAVAVKDVTNKGF